MHIALLFFFALIAGLLFLLAIAMLRRPMALVLWGKRVQGVVTSEHLFYKYGTRMRFYRVAFPLSNGAEAYIRSSASARWLRQPDVGATVVVLVTESGAPPRACIATWSELWLASVAPLLLGMLSITLLAILGLGKAW